MSDDDTIEDLECPTCVHPFPTDLSLELELDLAAPDQTLSKQFSRLRSAYLERIKSLCDGDSPVLTSISCILPAILFVGDLNFVVEDILSSRIRTVLSVCGKHNLGMFRIASVNRTDDEDAEPTIDVPHYSTRFRDDQRFSLTPHLRALVPMVEESTKPVFVHCEFGISRSVSICIGWMMWKYRMPFKEAYWRILCVRSCASPNLGFLRDLLEEEERLRLAE